MKELIALLIVSLVGASHSYSCTQTGNGDYSCRLGTTEDVFIESTGNRNGYNFLIVGYHIHYPKKRSLIKFEDIPPLCKTVLAATMHVHYWYGHKASWLSETVVPWIPRPIVARQVLKRWRENEATRDVRLANTRWSASYLNLNNVDARLDSDDTRTITRNTASAYVSWNITKTAKNWLRGQPNYGILLSAANEDVAGRDIRFYSREHSKTKGPYVEVLCSSDKKSGDDNSESGGVNYIRWGRTECPGTKGTEKVYSGVAAGSHYSHTGGGTQYLCLPDNPEYLKVTDGRQSNRNYVYGAEYETHDSPPALGSLFQHNPPCAVCYTAERVSKLMIPGKISCPSSWTREYYGYLMSEKYNHNPNSYECVDVNAESVAGSEGNTDGALFYFTEAVCTGISCPPYVNGHELACVVCTK